MCLAVPAKVIELKAEKIAVVELNGIRKEVSYTLTPEIKVNDFVLIHVGFTLSKLDEKDALETLQYLRELNEIH